MAETSAPSSNEPTAPEASASSGGSARLLILLAIMLIVCVLWGVDRFVFKPQVEEANKKLEDAIYARNNLAFDKDQGKSPFSRDDVRKVLGREPTRMEVVKDSLVEYYCWWGSVPVSKNYITVIYHDKDGKQIFSNVIENVVEPDDLPRTVELPPINLEPATDAEKKTASEPAPSAAKEGASDPAPKTKEAATEPDAKSDAVEPKTEKTDA